MICCFDQLKIVIKFKLLFFLCSLEIDRLKIDELMLNAVSIQCQCRCQCIRTVRSVSLLLFFYIIFNYNILHCFQAVHKSPLFGMGIDLNKTIAINLRVMDLFSFLFLHHSFNSADTHCSHRFHNNIFSNSHFSNQNLT